MSIRLGSVQVVPEFPVVRITFADGTQYAKDMTGLMAKGEVFAALRDRDFFGEPGAAHSVVTQLGEAGLCPGSSYLDATGRSGWDRGRYWRRPRGT